MPCVRDWWTDERNGIGSEHRPQGRGPVHMSAEALSVIVGDDGLASVSVAGWPKLRLDGLSSAVAIAQGTLRREQVRVRRDGAGHVEVVESFEAGLTLRRSLSIGARRVVVLASELANASSATVDVADVRLLRASGDALPGAQGGSPRVYEQGSCWCRVRHWGAPAASPAGSGEQDATQAASVSGSQYVWLVYDSDAAMALLVGFETGERWTGDIHTVWRGGRLTEWSVGLGCGLTRLQAGESWKLETLTIAAGKDPWTLLCEYGDRVRMRHRPRILDRPPVSWCSWYPFRLGVSEERVLANARIAAERLEPLGLVYMLLDLGWQAGYLPSSFSENDQFPSGLRDLSDRLARLGLKLGAWCAPFTISEHDPLVSEHPEWLLGAGGSETKVPQSTGTWF